MTAVEVPKPMESRALVQESCGDKTDREKVSCSVSSRYESNTRLRYDHAMLT